MKRALKILLLTVVLMTLLFGCGNKQNPTTTPEPNSTEQTQGEKQEDQTEVAAFPRTVTDGMGNEVVIKEQPKRVAVAFFRAAEHWYGLDMPPVGFALADDSLNNWAAYIPYTDVAEVVDIGHPFNIELMLDVEPDLIIAVNPLHDKVYEDLKKIAPVAYYDQTAVVSDWKNTMREFAKLVGKEQVAEDRIKKIEQQIADARKELSDYNGGTVAFLGMTDKNTFYAFNTQNLFAYYNKETGLGLPAPQGYPDGSEGGHSKQFSLEGLTELDPDHIFFQTFREGGVVTADFQMMLDELEKDAVWNTLKAVKNGNVHLIDRSAFNGGPLSIEYGVDAVVDYLSNK